MFTFMVYVAECQNSGDFVKFKYPKCNSQNLSSIDNGICENDNQQNTEACCGYDGGDCEEFNEKYPD